MSANAVSRNAKTVVSAIGGVLSVTASIAALAQFAPTNVWAPAGVVLAVLEVLRSVNVWLVRNEPVIDQVIDAGAELADDVAQAIHAPVPAAPAGTGGA